MKVSRLRYDLGNKVLFRWDSHYRIPADAGCYALANIDDEILYIGLSNNLNRRMGDHLNDPGKNCDTEIGRAVFFFYNEFPDSEIAKIEEQLLADHIAHEGCPPSLNIVAPN